MKSILNWLRYEWEIIGFVATFVLAIAMVVLVCNKSNARVYEAWKRANPESTMTQADFQALSSAGLIKPVKGN